jgi:type IV pilus assembly protein PilM
VAKKITTLYINDTSIRLMVTSGKRISKLADAPLDMNLADTSANVREAEIVTKIKQLFKTHNINAKKVIIGLSGLHCLSRPVSLPQLPKAMLDEAVVREAQRVLPVPTEQLYISWQITSAIEGKTQAFMLAIPRHIADTIHGILHQVGLKPYLMDVKPLALARLVKEATAIVVDVQAREFDIVIMADGVPQPVRTVPLPEDVLSLRDKVSIVKDELRRTVEFYNSNSPEKPLQPDVTMYVSGELADEPELYQSLAKELGYQVLPLSSPLKCPKQLDPIHYLVNIGLALKELPKEAGALLANLNALPVPYQPKPLSLGKIMAIPATAFAIGLIVLLAMNIQDAGASIDSVDTQIDATKFIIEQRQSQKKELTESIAALEKKLANTESTCEIFTATIDDFDEKGSVINGDLRASVNNLVYGVDLKGINHSGQDLRLHGKAPSEVELLAYARNLDASGRFSEVTISTLQRVEDRDEETEDEEIEGEDEEMEDEDEEMEGEDEETGDEDEGNEVMQFTLTLKLKGSE